MKTCKLTYFGVKIHFWAMITSLWGSLSIFVEKLSLLGVHYQITRLKGIAAIIHLEFLLSFLFFFARVAWVVRVVFLMW